MQHGSGGGDDGGTTMRTSFGTAYDDVQGSDTVLVGLALRDPVRRADTSVDGEAEHLAVASCLARIQGEYAFVL